MFHFYSFTLWPLLIYELCPPSVGYGFLVESLKSTTVSTHVADFLTLDGVRSNDINFPVPLYGNFWTLVTWRFGSSLVKLLHLLFEFFCGFWYKIFYIICSTIRFDNWENSWLISCNILGSQILIIYHAKATWKSVPTKTCITLRAFKPHC